MLPESVQNFIREHLLEDPVRLLLSAHRYPGMPMPLAVAQIEALRKVQHKIPSWYRFDLEFPAQLSLEQASSEATARFKAALIPSGRHMADLTGGMGVDAFFFAQAFEQLTYVERNPALAALARQNFAALGATGIRVVEADTLDFLQQDSASFDLIYLDPARRDAPGRRVFQLSDCQPDILAIQATLLQKAPKVLLKTAPMLDLQQAVAQLGTVTHIWVVSVDNEVKEVLYLLENEAPPPADIPVEAVCLGEPTRSFVFSRAEEQSAGVAFSAPLDYLYEPDAALLKAGAFKCLAQRFGLYKLHPNTHLYTSTQALPDWPGRAFRVEAVLKYDRRAVQAALPDGRANVAVRNFPDTAEAVRKKLGLKDGGAGYLFGAIVLGLQHPVLVLGKKL
ncbi:MAG: hypothetical protein IT260_02090 [Saprospiraceae bacterium]|nr:hypothetical protein [Saprospiraceae bacterium]